MDFKSIVMNRHAAKLFDGKKVPDEKIDELLELIRYAPSSFNIQPWKIIVVSDDSIKEKLSPASHDQPQIKSCSHLFVFCADKRILEHIENLEELMKDNEVDEEKINTSISMMKEFEKNLNDEKKIAWAQRQLYLPLGNALNGAKSLGLDSCPMEGFYPEDYSKILGLPDYLVPTSLCAIGYAKDEQKRKIRFDKNEVFDFR